MLQGHQKLQLSTTLTFRSIIVKVACKLLNWLYRTVKMSCWTTFEKPQVEPLRQSYTEEFVWKIPNFTEVVKSDAAIQQQVLPFMAGKVFGLPCKWRFALKSFTDPQSRKWIGVFLEMVELPGGVKATKVEFHVKIKNVAGRRVATYKKRKTGKRTLGYLDVEKGIYPAWGFDKLLCLHTNNRLPVQPDGCLHLEFLFRMYAPQPGKWDLATKMGMFTLRSKDQLFADLDNGQVLVGLGENAETKVVCKDGTEFPVNRGVLMARSPVFHRMFATERMTEMETGIVKIEDVPAKAMEVLLYYIHTGKLHDDWSKPEVVPGLLHAADKYQLELLREFLGTVCGEICTVENVAQLGMLTNRMKMQSAEKELLEFYKNHLESFEDLEASWSRIAQKEDDNVPAKIPKLGE